MSPEQCRGQRADALSDIYSLGCIMFECITGAPPFAAEGGLEIMYKHLNEAAPPIKAQAKAPESRRLAALVARCLEKDAARRYQSVAELKAEFNEVFAGDRSKIDLFTVKEKSKLSGASLAIMPIIFLCLAIPAAFFMFKNFGFSGTKSSDSVLVSDQDKVKRHIDLFKAKSFNDVNDYFGLGRNQLLSKSPLDVADAEKTYTDAIAKCQGKGSNHDRLSASYAMRAKTRWMLHKYKESLEDYDEAINIASKVEPDVEVLRDIYIEQTILFLGSRKLPEAYSAFYAASKNGFEKIPELSFSQQMEAADVVLNQHLDRMGDNRIGMLEQITTLMKQTQPRNKDEALQLLMLANQIAIVSHAIALSVGSDRAGTGPVLDYAVKILPMVQGHEDIKEQARALYKKLR